MATFYQFLVSVWILMKLSRLVHVFKNWKLLFENICENTCGWKNVWKCVKCCLKTENCCLKTQTKLKKCMHLHFFFSNFDVKNRSHGTIHIFKNYFTIVFSIFNKKSGIQTHPYFKLKRKIQIIICFSNISSIDFSKGLFLTPRYPNFCSSK